MTQSWTRRDVLRTVATAASTSVLAGLSGQRRRVGIVGAGMAGISLAWLLDGQRDVVVLEARDTIGGNVRSVDVELDGQRFVVDMGAQYFHPGPYPLYTTLLSRLNLYPPESTRPEQSHSFPASITVENPAELAPRFVSPSLPERWWPLLAPWNWAGTVAFAVAFAAAQTRERLDESWTLTLGDWLPTLGLSRDLWEGTLLPWAASLFTGDIEEARGMSARAAMIFAAKALPPGLFDPVVYYVMNQGLIEAMRRMLDQCSTVQVVTRATVDHVSREPHGRFSLRCVDGSSFTVDDLVFASSGPGTLQLLNGLSGTRPQQASLEAIEFRPARLALHSDPIYAPANPGCWSFLNCQITGSYCEASMWLAAVITGPPPRTAARLWKSWVTHRRDQPVTVLHDAGFMHMMPTPSTLVAQGAVSRLQGRDGLWFAGGFLHPYDSQETALRSALGVALGLGATSTRGKTLLAAADERDVRDPAELLFR